MAHLDIAVVAYRSGEDLEALVRDVPVMTDCPYTLRIWDNIGNPKTLTIAWNDLGREGDGSHIAFLNTDIRLSPGWASRLIRALDEYPEIGAVLPRPVGHEWPSQAGSPEGPFHDHRTAPPPPTDAMAEISRRWEPDRTLTVFGGEGDRASFYAVLVRRPTWQGLQGFDERFRFYGQDHDFQRRLDRIGRRTARVDGCPVWHRSGGSTAEAAKRGELDLATEMRHNGQVKSALADGSLRDWDLLSEAERSEIRGSRLYSRMPVFDR